MSDAPITVIFDLGNVLLDWDPRRFYRNLISDQAELDHFLTDICSPTWHHAQDSGGSTVEATVRLQAQHPEYAEMIAAFYPSWPRMTAGALPATVDILAELRAAGIRLIALTNWPAETFAPAVDRFPFFAWFEGIVVSGYEGLAKPDPAIFTRLLERYDVAPSTAVYVDDTARHVESARGLGLTAFVYTDAVSLRRDFASVGLPVSCDIAVRPAHAGDLPALTEIYNHYVEHTGSTFDITPLTPSQRRPWFEQYSDRGPHRLLVATRESRPVGYATSSRLRSKPAYDPSVEVTVYLHPDEAGQGIGSLLYQQLFADLRHEDVHRGYAAIAQPNPASVALHRRFGFVDVGTLHEVGRKHGRWWDVLWMERELP